MSNDVREEVQVRRNCHLAHNCSNCGVTIPAGDWFVLTPASDGVPECIECVRCVSDRIQKQECEASAAYEALASSSYDKAEAALNAMAAGIPYREDDEAGADEKANRELRSRLESPAISLPPSCSVCERYKNTLSMIPFRPPAQ